MSDRPLSERERRFVEAYLLDPSNQTAAAKAAGYKGNGDALAVQASRLLRRPKVQQGIAERVKASETANIATRIQRQEFWTTAMWDAELPFMARLKASELLGKSQADFIERHEHGGPDGQPIAHRVVFGGRYKP